MHSFLQKQNISLFGPRPKKKKKRGKLLSAVLRSAHFLGRQRAGGSTRHHGCLSHSCHLTAARWKLQPDHQLSRTLRYLGWAAATCRLIRACCVIVLDKASVIEVGKREEEGEGAGGTGSWDMS